LSHLHQEHSVGETHQITHQLYHLLQLQALNSDQ